MFLNFIVSVPEGYLLRLTVTKVVFELASCLLVLLYVFWLTVTKVVFEYGVLPSAGPLGIWLTVTKVVFGCSEEPYDRWFGTD